MRPLLLAALLTLPLVGCVTAQPPTDTGDPSSSTAGSPTSPSGTSGSTNQPSGSTTTALAYNPDMKVLFASDCVACHGSGLAYANYRMTTYAQVMAAVRPGSASSLLVSVTQSGGSMNRYLSGSNTTRQSKAAQIRTWIVTDNAQETLP